MSDSLRQMISQIANISQTVSGQSEELTQASSEVSMGADQIAITMQELASGSEQQASSSSDISILMSGLNHKISDASNYKEIGAFLSRSMNSVARRYKRINNNILIFFTL